MAQNGQLISGRTYMHRTAMDCAVEIVEYRPDSKAYLVTWLNLGYMGQPFYLGIQSLVEMDGDPDWVDVTDRTLVPRTKPGLPS